VIQNHGSRNGDIDARIEHRVWGGMTERERRALLKRRPHVTSWARLLDAACKAHDAASASSDRRTA
jgi:WhiB family redox-sensing transcriptional regulator